MSTLKVNAFQDTSGVPVYTLRAWLQFKTTTTHTIEADGGVSSLTDIGTGTSNATLDNALPAANGSVWVEPATYSSGVDLAVQSGGKITSTTVFKIICASNTSAVNDWILGYAGLAR